jgi:general secretion pathway protein E
MACSTASHDHCPVDAKLAAISGSDALSGPMRLQVVPTAEFDRQLQQTYERESNTTMQMVDGLGEDTDLFRVAQDLPEPSDLLESDDDAPIIRLINALLTSAVKENASDIHIEPFENRLVVRFGSTAYSGKFCSPAAP